MQSARTTQPVHSTDPAPSGAPGSDGTLERLLLEAQKVEARAKVQAAQQPGRAAFAPGPGGDAPRGEVTLGARAGSLASWLTHQVLADTAEQIALAVRAAHPQDQTEWRVLVTGDMNVLSSDVQARSVRDALTRRKAELGHLLSATKQAATELDRAVSRYARAESNDGHGSRSGDRPVELDVVRPSVADNGAGGSTEPRETGTPTGTAAGPVQAAADVVGLVATDFTVLATEVPVETSLLAVLATGALSPGGLLVRETFDPASQAVIRAVTDSFAQAAAKPDVAPGRVQQAARRAFNQAQHAARAQVTSRAEKIQVKLDSFAAIAEHSSTFTLVSVLAAKLDELDAATLELRKKLAPVAADLADRRAQLDKARQDWANTLTDPRVPDPGASALKADVDMLTGEIASRERAVGPARAVLDHALAAAAVARTDLTAASTPDATGLSPVARACAREALHGIGAITHVLYVQTAQAGADVITRRSVLGSSARVSYLGGVTAAWALLDVATGAVVTGGATERARQLTHDLTTGRTSQVTDLAPDAKRLSRDPLATWETLFRVAVLLLAATIVLLGVVGSVALLRSTFP
ncbi:hypothetical protein KRR39_09770 [Nocardioides panacis]|uniref:Uncharacterized protein n=1 Tax=Nocardioides panacis TaxID=2849501 RepID=A0A975T1N9_9ACTN|nr:hypothetical protein [Nocardioides panacis]QWZ09985.1 hypothetical protein KRR39_09770 [Nocardioides panacis]